MKDEKVFDPCEFTVEEATELLGLPKWKDIEAKLLNRFMRCLRGATSGLSGAARGGEMDEYQLLCDTARAEAYRDLVLDIYEAAGQPQFLDLVPGLVMDREKMKRKEEIREKLLSDERSA